MTYEKIGAIIRKATPEETPPLLSPEQIERLKRTSEIVLVILAGAGIVALTAISPNILGAMAKLWERHFPDRRYSKRERDQQVTHAFYYLKRSGQIRLQKTKNDFLVSLTPLGKKRLQELDFKTLSIPKPVRWDKKWWLVAADIPTKKYRIGADLLRAKLRQMKFYRLQRTLWLYSYDPRREIEFIVNRYRVERFVTVMEINRLDQDDEEKLRDFFEAEGILS